MAWPSMRDFSNAMLNPEACFEDPELAGGDIALHPIRRTPVVWPGNFAAVYKVAGYGQDFAVRCFTREVSNHQDRYNRLSQYLQTANPPGFVEFDYQSRGILVGGEWYPIVKMDWVNGQRLDEYIDANLQDRGAMQGIAAQWRATAADLQTRDIAHNDLQHGNVMVLPDGNIKLVDYDGSFLPQFRGRASPEEGHRNFQHPERTARDYDAHIDNFPALVIYVSLLAVAADPDLWARYNNGENLIFTKTDFAQPQSSNLFQTLKGNGDTNIRHLAGLLEHYCARPVADAPTLERALSGPPVNRSATRDWFMQRAAESKPAASAERQQLPEQSQNSAVKIDRNAILQFCRGLDGQTLKTLNQATFTLRYYAPYIHIQQKSISKSISESGFNNFLDQFEKMQSWNGRDYQGIEGTSTFCLAILRKYIDSHLVNILKSSTDLAAVQAELQAAADKKFHSIETELQTVRQQADADKVEANRKLLAAQDAQRKAETDKASADRKLLAAQDAQRKAESDKANADRRLLAAQDAQRKAESDKTEANRKFLAAHDAQRKAESDKANAERRLRLTEDNLHITQQQAAKDVADAEEKVLAAQAAQRQAENGKNNAETKLQQTQVQLQTALDQAALDKDNAEQKLQAAQTKLQAAREQVEADKTNAEQKSNNTQAQLQAARQQAANDKVRADIAEAKLDEARAELARRNTRSWRNFWRQ